MDIQQVHHHLESHDINPSFQRVAIMKFLLEHHLAHLTVEQIYSELLPSMPTLSKATVYNTIKLFVEKKAISSMFIDERNVRYGINTETHAHFKCRDCSRIYDVPLEESDIPQFRGNPDLLPYEVQVYFMGSCKKCSEVVVN